MNQSKEAQKERNLKVNITFPLEGDEAERFLAYKREQFLKNNAEAARKLMLERLSQVAGQAA